MGDTCQQRDRGVSQSYPVGYGPLRGSARVDDRRLRLDERQVVRLGAPAGACRTLARAGRRRGKHPCRAAAAHRSPPRPRGQRGHPQPRAALRSALRGPRAHPRRAWRGPRRARGSHDHRARLTGGGAALRHRCVRRNGRMVVAAGLDGARHRTQHGLPPHAPPGSTPTSSPGCTRCGKARRCGGSSSGRSSAMATPTSGKPSACATEWASARSEPARAAQRNSQSPPSMRRTNSAASPH